MKLEDTKEKYLEKEVQYAFLDDNFFAKSFTYPDEILDIERSKDEREKRAYIYLKLEFENNTFLLPLRNFDKSKPTYPFFINLILLVFPLLIQFRVALLDFYHQC